MNLNRFHALDPSRQESCTRVWLARHVAGVAWYDEMLGYSSKPTLARLDMERRRAGTLQILKTSMEEWTPLPGSKAN